MLLVIVPCKIYPCQCNPFTDTFHLSAYCTLAVKGRRAKKLRTPCSCDPGFENWKWIPVHSPQYVHDQSKKAALRVDHIKQKRKRKKTPVKSNRKACTHQRIEEIQKQQITFRLPCSHERIHDGKKMKGRGFGNHGKKKYQGRGFGKPTAMSKFRKKKTSEDDLASLQP